MARKKTGNDDGSRSQCDLCDCFYNSSEGNPLFVRALPETRRCVILCGSCYNHWGANPNQLADELLFKWNVGAMNVFRRLNSGFDYKFSI